ncbi:DUF3016 domain-containing protein [Methylobacterium sp. ID0610]|uniref:DUF3016 domain-containing protein n=1 Tax=Methylobacterium carpenticola TaxID=3344827 RepID=UPI0036C9DE16
MIGTLHAVRCLAVAAGLLGAGPAAAQQVRVRYVAPERFTDAQTMFGSGLSLRATLAEMTRILEELGRARLRPGESLDLTVLDIDLAGFERPGLGAPTGIRVVTDATPPRIRLAYGLRRGRQVVRQGEETISDINFLLGANPRFSGGGLYYERALLRDWFAKRFPAPTTGG